MVPCMTFNLITSSHSCCTVLLCVEDFDSRGELRGIRNISGTGILGSISSPLVTKQSEDEPVDHFSFLNVGDEHSHSNSIGMGIRMGMEDAFLTSKDKQKERVAVKKSKGVLHGFRSSVFCNKINSPPNTVSSSSSHSHLPNSPCPLPSDTSGNDIDFYYEVAKSCISPLLVRAGFEEIDGIVEYGPQAGT